MSDDKYINRLKNDIVVLQAQNKELEQKLREALMHLKDADNMCRALNNENGAARRIIWAIAHSQGGRIEIPDTHMAMAGGASNQITSKYDKSREVTVIGAESK